MVKNRRLVFVALAVAALQIGFLVYMIVGRAAILRNGEVVVLEVEPVDPRDLLRGDYVALGYNISRVDAALLADVLPPDAEAGERRIFVRLAPDGEGIWQPIAASFDRKPEPAAVEGQVDIRGTAHVPADGAETLAVDYGIERFYVPEGEGRPIEADLTARDFFMHVAVSAGGEAQIKSFHDADEVLFEEPLY